MQFPKHLRLCQYSILPFYSRFTAFLPTSIHHQRFFHATPLSYSVKPFLADEHVLSYTEKHTSRGPAYMDYIYTNSLHAFPEEAKQMISRPQALFLTWVTRITKAEKVLEIGSLLGYSSLALAEGVKERKEPYVLSLEKDPIYAKLAKKHIQMAKMQKIVEIRCGKALETMNEFDDSMKFDLIFLDANKSGYTDYYDLIMEKDLLTRNGLMVVDNGYVHPRELQPFYRPPKKRFSKQEEKLLKVAEETDERYKKIGRRLQHFNRHVAEDPTTEQMLVPMFDGMMFIWKRRPGRNAWAAQELE
ncbi:7099_t:CDS:2 [Paraglomus brasilianum]|uniref:7099_t:CDS:1 n=1 Tax=Paraglomus brasilianum TaxID=144538 RepID=A0A9N9AJ58_9GLOM|nr:7099_t:CDS:2 [Paraglomus brasilianum]